MLRMAAGGPWLLTDVRKSSGIINGTLVGSERIMDVESLSDTEQA